MALWLNGPIIEVTAMTETFIKERKHNLTGKVEPVGIDDASAFLCRFANGSMATFEATRYARGHKALFTLEINGEQASAAWDLHDLHRLEYFDHRDEGRLRGWKSIHITDGDHPYMKNWWVPGLQIGYEHTFIHQVADFLQAVGKKEPAAPTFADGLATDYVTDAVLKSAKTRQWEKVRVEEVICKTAHHRFDLSVADLSIVIGYQAPAHHAGGGFTQPDPIDFNDHEGWTQIFDGKTLKAGTGPPKSGTWKMAAWWPNRAPSILQARPTSSGAAASRPTSS